ncbi:MAG TPA: hypothetical protein VEY89_13895 [Candidatus Dormibacteraeota bacterium]|nr:hypothetical protein [Candidatus Dormibacteraeota bacterium]
MPNLHLKLLPLLAALLVASALPADQVVATQIEFTPQVEAQLQRYGDAEGATLRAAIVGSVQHATARLGIPRGALVKVTVLDVAPTHPTRAQQSDDPAQDLARTKYLGGAALEGSIQDASKQVLARVSYRHFAPTLALGSASLDPWADARLAIDAFAGKLAAACCRAAAPSQS